jgi:phosphotriesterase-related protein
MGTAPTIITVTGEIAASELGQTLAHEHLWCDISVQSQKPDNVLQDVALMTNELRSFLEVDGRTVIEVTPEDLGRNPGKLRELSLASGVQIVSGIAFYDESLYPPWVREANVGTIANYFVRHVEEGVAGVRAGLIGEVASHNETDPNPLAYRLRPLETKVFQAAAQAQQTTGVAISTHASLGRAGHAQLDVLEAAGANLKKVAVGHCDAHCHSDAERDFEYYLPILERGAFCQFDLIGWEELAPDPIRALRIAALLELGYERQILLSTDTCRLSQLHTHGGRGFDYLWSRFLPRLLELGVTKAQVHSMLVEAPLALLGRS